jgi:enamine deaminase RidA (YjgF/YER057c/UK114 family)
MTARPKTFTPKSLFDRAQEIFATEFPADDSRITCTFDLVFLSGWAPHASQPKALKPGSVTKSLQQALEEAKSSLGN